ncbi:MAG TPA: hypothetical protein VKR30_08945 [Candidatus Limnocylindrales bacterium]|nr:hypothetical protein [Candidatus Limnocylindrales bacterium]
MARPILVVNPRKDETFAAAAAACSMAASTPIQLANALRPRYPHVAVHSRTLSDEPAVTWYVYREGYWVTG